MPSSWVEAIVRAGAVPACYVPEASVGRSDMEAVAGAEAVEDPQLSVHPLDDEFSAPAAAFLDGIQHWRVVAYDRVTPVVRAHVAAAVRQRGPDRRLRTALQGSQELVLSRLAALSPAVRRELERAGAEVVDLTDADAAQPGRALEHARRAVEQARVELERALGERYAPGLAPDEWLVPDGVLSESAPLPDIPACSA